MKASQAIVHYSYWHRHLLVEALPWASKLFCYTFIQAERTLAAIGIIGTGVGMFHIARNTLRKIQLPSRMKWIETIIIYAGHWLMHDYS
jgi:hypothetical protein